MEDLHRHVYTQDERVRYIAGMISIYLQIRLAQKLLDQTVTYLSQG